MILIRWKKIGWEFPSSELLHFFKSMLVFDKSNIFFGNQFVTIFLQLKNCIIRHKIPHKFN